MRRSNMSSTVFYTLLQVPKEVYYSKNKKGMYGDMQLISDIFGQFDNSERKPFLFRKEIRTTCIEFIVRSSIRPTEIDRSYKSRVKEVPATFFDRDRAVIKVTLNPIVQKAGQKNSKKVPLRSEEDIRAYVNRVFLRSGMEPVSLKIGKSMDDIGLKKGHRITVSKVNVEGIVKVTDKETFRESISKGLGAAKRFGCGLALIK
jgi:CRISPR-associated protein Cas6/Cse3/CasE subtype I-E